MMILTITVCTTHGEVRLIGGSSALEGRVEVCVSGTWGTVCHDHWSSIDAQVVCRQQGFSPLGIHDTLFKCYNILRHTITDTGSFARTNAYFGRGTVPILLDNVACRGTESRLIDCIYSSHTSDCNHGEDAGVTCQPANYNSE